MTSTMGLSSCGVMLDAMTDPTPGTTVIVDNGYQTGYDANYNRYRIGYEEARREALFLSDKMAYELGLTTAQYAAVYEINLDYLLSVDHYDNLYTSAWSRRNSDLFYVLDARQFNRYMGIDYFYRPVYWYDNRYTFGVYVHYSNHNYYYNARPSIYDTYRGGHNNGSYYNGRFGKRYGEPPTPNWHSNNPQPHHPTNNGSTYGGGNRGNHNSGNNSHNHNSGNNNNNTTNTTNQTTIINNNTTVINNNTTTNNTTTVKGRGNTVGNNNGKNDRNGVTGVGHRIDKGTVVTTNPKVNNARPTTTTPQRPTTNTGNSTQQRPTTTQQSTHQRPTTTQQGTHQRPTTAIQSTHQRPATATQGTHQRPAVQRSATNDKKVTQQRNNIPTRVQQATTREKTSFDKKMKK